MANKPMIKPSHRGLFTKKANAAGESVHEFAEEKKHSPNATLRDEANFALNFGHGTKGTVSKVEAHEDGKHAVIHVRHKHPKPKRGATVPVDMGYGDSRVLVPMKHAAKYHIGQSVGVGMMDADGDSPDTESPAEDAKESYRSMRNRIVAEPSNRKAGK